MSDKPRTVVIGAGPSGLTAAYELTRAGIDTVVLEKDGIVGGIARTESHNGYHFDMGGHRFFTKSKEVNEIWKDILADEFLQRPRLSRIYYKRKFFHYPLKPFNALKGLGIIESVLIGCSYVRWHLFPYREEETFEQWVTNRFGKRLFLTFFKTYTEKVWGISCQELKAEWAAQRIKDLSLKTVIVSMFRKPGTRIKTLIEQFDYPRLGPGQMWRRVADIVEENGGQVRLNCGVKKIRRDGNRVLSVVIDNGDGEEEITGSNFISSMPLTECVQKMDDPPSQDVVEASTKLNYRDFLTVCLIVNKEHLFSDNWIYVHDSSVHVGRIQNYKNWSPEMVPDPEKTGLGLEYFCNEGDWLWTMSDEDLIELGRKEIDRLELANYDDVEDGVVYRVAKSYPVYDGTYRDHLAVLREYVDNLDNFQTIGRNGLHRYNNQDHAMLTGIKAVRNQLDGEKNDLWSVNADQEYHEEIREGSESEDVREALGFVFDKLDRIALGASLGAVSGAMLFLMTLILVVRGGDVIGPRLSLLGQFFPGYDVTLVGSLVGLAYGFGLGFVLGWLFAFLRNVIALTYFSLLKARVERSLWKRVIEFI